MTPSGLTRGELLRYARHLALPRVGLQGQRRLKEAKVLCVGVGGLGSPLAIYLAAAGVGTLGLVDPDVVDVANLQRQILHGTRDVGRSKLDSAADRLRDVNPHVAIVRHHTRLTPANALEIMAGYDVVVDGTDNFPTRYLVNDACVLAGKPNVYGSVLRWEGQVSVFAMPGGPCYRCLFRDPPPPGLVPDCAESGVLGVLPGIIGSLQAMATVKLILGVGETLAGRLVIFDAVEMSWREVAVRRNPGCPVCGDHPTQKELIDYDLFCGITTVDRAEPPVPRMEPSAVEVLLASDAPPTLVDVREPWEWEAGSLQSRGAVLIPLDELPDRITEIPRGRATVLYCRNGARSAVAVRRLIEEGRGKVYNLQGGLQAWARDVDPDVTVV